MDEGHDVDLRSVLESVTVFVAGYNRIDPRWHDPTEYTCKLYGPVHPLIQNIQTTKGFDPELLGIPSSRSSRNNNSISSAAAAADVGGSNSNSVVCFWATDGLECLDLAERSEGTWRDWTSTVVVTTDTDNEESDRESEEEEDDDDDGSEESDDGVDEEDEDREELSSQADESDEDDSQGNDESDVTGSSSSSRQARKVRRKNLLAFTFRVDIPHDIPPSMHGTTCRYYYTAHVLIKTETQQQVLKRSFQVTTHPQNHHQSPQSSSSSATTATTGRVRFGTCQGMAHSVGLPCHVSSMDIHRPIGQISVQPPFDIRRDRSDIQTIRVCTSSSTPSLPVCLLTIIGSQHLTPNGRLQLQWDFPSTRIGRGFFETPDNNGHSSSSFAPCYQIAACLKGEEVAVFEDGTTKRTQTLLFDTCHEYVVPDVTQSVTKTLWLDGNMTSGDRTPCQITSDIMSLKVWCQVDITIIDVDATRLLQTTSTGSNVSGDVTGRSDDPHDPITGSSQTATQEVLLKPNYSNLSLEIPIRIRHYLENEDEVMEQQENRVKPLKELLGLDRSTIATTTSTDDSPHVNGDDYDVFRTDDILSDLKTLSLKVEELVRIDGDRGWI